VYICICNAVTERDIRQCVSSCGACSLEDLQRELGVAAGCGCCRETAQSMLPVPSNITSVSAEL